MHENIIKAFPVAELNGSSVPTSTRRLSSHDVKRIEGEIKRLEDWNARFLKRAIEYLFFGQIHTPSASERERIIHSYEALDRVINLRKAVRESLTEATLPSKLLLDEDPGTSTRRRLHANNDESLLWAIQTPALEQIL